MTRDIRLDQRAISALLADTDPYLSCDDCFDQVDAAIDALLAAGTPLDPPFRTHLASCGVCHEEALALIELIAPEHGVTREEAVARLEGALAASEY